MKKILIFIGLFLLTPFLWAQQADSLFLKLDLSQASFAAFVTAVENQSPYQRNG